MVVDNIDDHLDEARTMLLIRQVDRELRQHALLSKRGYFKKPYYLYPKHSTRHQGARNEA